MSGVDNKIVGLTFKEIIVSHDDYVVDFKTIDGRNFRMYHIQDCCEGVSFSEIVGDLNDIIGSEILSYEEVSDKNEGNEGNDNSFTWTFYKFSTIKGSVTLRWYGTSNGYYSERVDFDEVTQ